MRKLSPPLALLLCLLLTAALSACSGDSAKDATDAVPSSDAPLADLSTGDVVADDGTAADLAADVEPGPFPLPALTEPVPLRAGAVERLMPVPLGIPICGFAPPNKPKSPYSGDFPGSSQVYNHPTLGVVVLEGGTSRLLFVRMDLIGVNASLVDRVAHDLSQRTGYDWTGKVIFGASHTHSSAGRLAKGLIWSILADSFFPALFERMVGEVVDMAEEAILAMEPARLGYGVVETDRLHNDRRCENPELRDDRLHLVRIDRADSTLHTLLMVHSVHGTVLGVEGQHLSRDAVGGIEAKVRESFDEPVHVFFFQAGAGDMAPASPPVDEEGDLPAIPHDYNRMEAIGVAAAEVVQGVVDDIETTDDVALDGVSFYVPLGRDELGYAEGEFPFEGGGAYCGSTVDSDCWTGEPTPIADLDKKCIDIGMMAAGLGFEDEAAPDRTLLSAARLGDVLLVTFPGEPVTGVLLDVEEQIRDRFPAQETIVVLGYSQDYVGYSTQEWDFYQGGYEASGAIWGPRQGDYLAARAADVAAALLDPETPLAFDAKDPFPLIQTDAKPYLAEHSKSFGDVVTQPAATVAAGETVVFEFSGGSPWLLMPEVTLEKEVGGTFEPVRRHNGDPVTSRGYEFLTTLHPTPDYETNLTAKTRLFTWRVEMPTDRRVPADHFPLAGTYRLRANGRYMAPGLEAPETYEILSDPFVVE